MAIKIEKDLGNITARRARGYVDLFHKQYKGLLDAVSNISANYNDDGLIDITYVVNSKSHTITIGNVSVYVEEVQKRKEKEMKRK